MASLKGGNVNERDLERGEYHLKVLLGFTTMGKHGNLEVHQRVGLDSERIKRQKS